MSRNLLRDMTRFLENSDLGRQSLEIVPVTFNYENKPTLHFGTHVKLGGENNQINSQAILAPILRFTAIDTMVDILYPDAATKSSFKAKLGEIKGGSEISTIIRQIYRLSKLLRNAGVHNRGAFRKDDNDTVVDYVFNKTNYSVRYSDHAINLLNFLCLLLLTHEGETYSDPYLKFIAISYYDFIRNSFRDFKDEFNAPLEEIPSKFKLLGYRRFRIPISSNGFDESSGNYINCRMEAAALQLLLPDGTRGRYASEDFVFFDENRHFIMPSEALAENEPLTKARIMEWEINERNRFK